MNKTLLAILLLGWVGFGTTCKKTEPAEPLPASPMGTLRINVVGNFDGQPFVINNEYLNVHNYRVKVSELKFYMSDITATKNGFENYVGDIALIDFKATTQSVDLAISEGTYDGIKFGVGVPAQLNGTSDPDFNASQYASNHPLSVTNSGMYWAWSTGYIFSMFDGKYDTLTGGTGPIIDPYFFHVGTNSMYRDKEVGGSFTITEGQTTTFNLNLDVGKLFYSSSDTIDVKIDNFTHTSGNVLLATRFMDIFMEALTN